ncbi:PTPA-domain-containing protein [Laetiporus sulphureus 93-53]|uniref:Serine/threonine-protein phosphatase 2A activator n=1 Tax=Laetiporus sulphureus 93-53 TaxID=1314785 RepID=A0A165E1I6_9APHY|nr:PTPA-domain-containing protein [Laetiporus sulphureus 93-53]KZT06068.1 PTPA-domain-containing protein [Laetiporus sulphureus 93-53]
MSMAALPALREVSIQELLVSDLPSKRIHTDYDVERWKSTRGYRDYGLFLRRLNESVVGYTLPWIEPMSEATALMISTLDMLDRWIDEIPPLPTPQRFGNLAFRSWGRRLETEADTLLTSLLPAQLHPAIPYVVPYFLTSFGSFIRMDYGSGHEASFALLLLCLTLIRFFLPEPIYERELVLCVFVRYLRLCWRLQDVYNLEPAGSHGVWGLDDSHFLGYIFGSGQLRDQTEIPVSAVLRSPLPATNLYFMQIMRIHEVKHGPFHEHSSQLHSIAVGVASWAKVNSGLFKMYEAEVLGKRVVVQHLPLGGLLDWDTVVASHVPHSQEQATSSSSSHASLGGRTPTARHSSIVDPAANMASITPFPSHSTSVATRYSDPYPHHNRPDACGSIVPSRMPLGPTASTSLRPRSGPSHMGPPTTASTTTVTSDSAALSRRDHHDNGNEVGGKA